jgi:signal transduction histidine kinase
MEATSHRDDRIRAEKLRLLYRGNFAVPANFIISCVVASLLWDTFPQPVLLAWLGATLVVAALRIVIYRRFVRASMIGICSLCWAGRFCIGSLASGLLWGAICLGLPVWGNTYDYVVMTLVVSGISAGALTTIVTYLPAYLVYVAPMIVPLAVGLLLYRDPGVATIGWLMFLFLGVLGLAAKNLSRSAVKSIELHIDNELLNESLEKTRSERDAARKEKWTTLGQLSHELRTPLNAIMGFSEAMFEEYFGPLGNARYKDYAGHVNQSGRHLLRLVDELLELSRSESGTLEMKESPVEVDILLASCIDIMKREAESASLTLNRHFAGGLPLLRADKTKVRQMVLSLLSNAIKFTAPGGEVSLSAFAAPGGLAVTVQDTGIGMTSEDVVVAMQPFGRIASHLNDAKPGMGLGLPMVKRLAEMHGAEFTIVSEPDRGTTCTLWFPAERCIGETAPPEGSVFAAAFAA